MIGALVGGGLGYANAVINDYDARQTFYSVAGGLLLGAGFGAGIQAGIFDGIGRVAGNGLAGVDNGIGYAEGVFQGVKPFVDGGLGLVQQGGVSVGRVQGMEVVDDYGWGLQEHLAYQQYLEYVEFMTPSSGAIEPVVVEDMLFSGGSSLLRFGVRNALRARRAISITRAVGAAPRGFSAASRGGSNIALGVNEHLDKFARIVNGSTWEIWGRGDFKSQFLKTINNSSNQIHFNLTGPDGKMLNVWKSVSEGARGFGSSRATSWELYQLYSNPAALNRTTFYLNGKVMPSPF